jgi:hypothetical protein
MLFTNYKDEHIKYEMSLSCRKFRKHGRESLFGTWQTLPNGAYLDP